MDVVAVQGIVKGGVGAAHLGAGSVLGDDGAAVLTGELILIQGLQAVGALVLAVDKANHLGGGGGVGIVPLGVVGHVDAGLQVILVDEGPDLVCHVVLHLLGDDLVGVFGLIQALDDLLSLHPQDGREIVGDEVVGPLDLGLLLGLDDRLGTGVAELVHGLHLSGSVDVTGGEDHVLHRAADGQDGPVGIVDGATVGGGGDLTGLLGNGLGLQGLMLDHLELPEL